MVLVGEVGSARLTGENKDAAAERACRRERAWSGAGEAGEREKECSEDSPESLLTATISCNSHLLRMRD
ncbi:hypothetical protein ACH5RR_015465 [Cinchona calisaya]|uniref:Uncharacterized protein n=1 Tax=Cinchona calisaya TaxID=153742 RepID=A0ABD2ZT72_9GENT